MLPDLADDAATGVRGLPHRLGATGSSIAAAALLLGATAHAGLRAARAAVVGGLGGRRGRRRGPSARLVRRPARARGRGVAMFRAVIVVALIDVLLLIFSGRVV